MTKSVERLHCFVHAHLTQVISLNEIYRVLHAVLNGTPSLQRGKKNPSSSIEGSVLVDADPRG